MGVIWLDVRKLAALDMALHGPRFIVIEFALGVGGCALLGGLSLMAGIRQLDRGITWQLIVGAGLLWIALNYVPLLLHSIDLARRKTAREEVAAELASHRLMRRYGALQLWILVPFAVVLFAFLQRRPRTAD